ncbi:GNAT family N-acetyltransferase [Haloparvum alkalitolerans]|uniref:GNAT family N-acetyltransferase n=1 Tax=Haloparvum alkalitolerans TaxID=1042953 RepID=UPI003CE83222
MRDPATDRVTVRDAAPADDPRIAAVAETCWRTAYADLLREETIDRALDAWYDEAVLRERVDGERTFLVVGAGAGDIVGYASAGREAGEDGRGIHLGSIYVRPDRWGDGVGSALLSAFLETCRETGYDRVHAIALAENDRACAFYRSRGFSLYEERESDLFGETVTDAEYVREV